MQFVEITHFDAIEKGDKLLIEAKPEANHINVTINLFTVKQIKNVDGDKEIILMKAGNIWFGLKRYLSGKSWVKHAVKVIP